VEDTVIFRRCLHESGARPSVLSVWENAGSALIRAGIAPEANVIEFRILCGFGFKAFSNKVATVPSFSTAHNF
jgi:hypothetical protein